jgi:hypothetical protein
VTNTGLWVGSMLLLIAFIAMAGTTYGYHNELQELHRELDGDGDEAGLKRKTALLEGRLNQLARYVMDHDQLGHASTGPINMDRPTLAQIAAPTVPDLEAQHPPVPGAETYGRHHAREVAA